MKKSGVRYIDLRLVAVQIICLACIVALGFWYRAWTHVYRVEFSSAEYSSSYTEVRAEQVKRVVEALDKAKEVKGPIPAERFILKLYSQREIKSYAFVGENRLYDLRSKKVLEPDRGMRATLRIAMEQLRKRSPYGEMVSWSEVKYLFPQGVIVEVNDLETGKKFQVQRYAGYNHADVLPVTPKDRATIKDIYSGQWSWKRKAVVVLVGGRKVAASMSGMPHEKRGYFDLRFPLNGDERNGDSLSHRMMYFKAAGKTTEMIRQASPTETILLIFTAIDQRDWATLKGLLTSNRGIEQEKLQNIINATIYNIKERDNLGYELLVSLSFKNGPYNHKRTLLVKLRKNERIGCYQAEPEFLSGLLAQIR